jgi:hypothetical protein
MIPLQKDLSRFGERVYTQILQEVFPQSGTISVFPESFLMDSWKEKSF